MAEHKNKKEQSYLQVLNFKSDVHTTKAGAHYITLTEGTPLFRKAKKKFPDHIIDERCLLFSIGNELFNSVDFIYNYAELNTIMFKDPTGFRRILNMHVPDGESEYKIPKVASRYINMGYVPIIFLPTPIINMWTPPLLARLNYMQNNGMLTYIQVPSVSFIHTKRLSTYDYWVHRMDLSRLMKIPPEQIRMVDAIKEVLKI